MRDCLLCVDYELGADHILQQIMARRVAPLSGEYQSMGSTLRKQCEKLYDAHDCTEQTSQSIKFDFVLLECWVSVDKEEGIRS